MITKENILKLAEPHLAGTELYITGVKISADNHISILLDGDRGVNISDCVALSRAVESGLDRNKEDFALDVSSHGATSPLLLPRQYKKHIGRELEVKLLEGGKLEGRMVAADDEKIRIEYEVRENKPLGKGKITVTKGNEINYKDIKEAKIKLKF